MKDNNDFYRSVSGLIQSGDFERAIIDINNFLEREKNDETALSLLSNIYLRKGDKQTALKTVSKMAETYPTSYAAHADMGFIAMNFGELSLARSSFEKATELKEDFYQAWAFLGKLYFEAKQYEKAVSAVDTAERFDPFDEEYRLMRKAMQEGDIARAEQIAREMLKRQPGHPRAGFMLAHVASRVEAHEERAEILKHCLDYHPANKMLRTDLISTFEALGEYGLALSEAEILVKVDPSYLSHWIKSRVHSNLGDHKNALQELEQAAKLVDPGDEELGKIDLLRGHSLRTLGRREESQKAYRACLKNTPNNGAGWWGLADLKNYKFSSEDKSEMEHLSEDEKIDTTQRCQAAFALAKAHDNEKDAAEAFKWYKKANDLRTDAHYDPAKNDEYCDLHVRSFDQKLLEKQATPNPDGPTPIFIVGMPRAGSTLIEQILASHSQIEGTMELSILPKIERQIKISGGRKYKKHYPECFGSFNEQELLEFGQRYVDMTASYRTDRSYFIDKLPPNFERVGLIHKIMPNAIIIDARRHPLDCGYSAYKQHFAAGHEYSYDLGHIGNYYNGYLKFMDHWDQVLPGKVLCIQYEDMIHNTKEMVHRLLEHIGVPFEDACLNFYENKRAVRTASSEQVRQPINTKGIGPWKKVEKELKPLIESLGSDTLKRFEKYLS